MSATAKNLEALDKAVRWHAANCEFALVEIRMNGFEVERLGWEEFQGVPIVGDSSIGTGRFHLICAGPHGEGSGNHVVAKRQDRELVNA